jgi:hypothetical protein
MDLGPEDAETWTAGEHRASRGATAGWVGKALEAEKPMDGCGMKQGHEVARGFKPLRG